MKKEAWILILVLLTSFFQVFELARLGASSKEGTVYTRETSSEVFIGNDFLEIGFKKDCGAIWTFIHKASGVDLRGLKNQAEGLWDVVFLTEDYETLGPSGLQRSHPYYNGYSINQTLNEITIRLEWRKVKLKGYGEYPARLTASVSVTSDSPLARFSIEIDNSGSGAIEYVAFPLLWEVSKLGNQSSDDKLLIPEQNGRIFENPVQSLDWYGNCYPSGFLNMQFMAYYDSETGFYFATYDSDVNTKDFFWKRVDSSSFQVAILHYPAINFGEDFSLTYEVVAGVFTGNWYTAADLYKQWALNQSWSQTREIPRWLKEVAVARTLDCYTAYGSRNVSFSEAGYRIEEHDQFFELPTLVGVLGWENKCAWSFGDYFPPYEGWEEFDELVQVSRESNSRLWLCIRALGITTDSEPWKNGTAKSYAIMNKDGSYNMGTAPGCPWPWVYMCPSTDYWRKTLKGYILTLVEHGVEMIDLDAFPILRPQPCYNESHGHPPGMGGNWYSVTWLDILGEIKEEARQLNPNFAFSGELGCEPFLPFLEIYGSRDSFAEIIDYIFGGTPSWQNESVIPLFNYIYGDRLTFIGNHRLGLFTGVGCGPYNRLGFARILTWGEICDYWVAYLGLYHWNVDRVTLDYVKKIAGARASYLHNFFVNATMVRPEEIASPTTLVRAETDQYFNVSALQYSAWKPNGTDCIGYILTNIATSDIEVNQSYDVPLSPPYNVYLFRDGKLELTETFTSETRNLNFTVEPLDIILLVFGDLHQVWMRADLDFDGVVNILDISIVAKAFGTKLGDIKWDPNADINKDGVVNILDVSMVAKDFGKTWQSQ